MKAIYTMASVLILSASLHGQGHINTEIDLLEARKQRLQSTIKYYTDSINAINEQIGNLTRQNLLNNPSGLIATLNFDADVTEKSDRSKKIGTFAKGDSVVIQGYEWWQFLATNGTVTGFINVGVVVKTVEIEAYEKMMSEKTEKQRENEREANVVRREAEAKEKAQIQKENLAAAESDRRNAIRQKFLTRYGENVVAKVTRRIIWIGMTDEMAIYSRGKPLKINRTVGNYGSHEQWVYSRGVYLYFENGLLTSFQDSR